MCFMDTPHMKTKKHAVFYKDSVHSEALFLNYVQLLCAWKQPVFKGLLGSWWARLGPEPSQSV